MPSSEEFERKLGEVRKLLDRETLVLGLSQRQRGPRPEAAAEVTRRQLLSGLNHYLNNLHVADVARIMESLPSEDRERIWEIQHRTRGGVLLLELGDSVLKTLMADISEASLVTALGQLDADDLSYISEFVPAELLETRLAALNHEDRDWVRLSRSFPPDSVGARMSQDMLLARQHERIEDILRRIRESRDLPDHLDLVFVTTVSGEYIGYLPIETLLVNQPDTVVSGLIRTDLQTFAPEQDAEPAANAFERYDLVSAPVVNERGRLLGRLSSEAMMETLRDEHTEDALYSAGLKKEEDLFAPIWDSARNRWGWLALSLLTAMVASRVIGLFEHTIMQIVALAALMPIVAAIGGNTANQTTTLIVRALALEQISRDNVWHMISKELRLSLLNGLFWGSLVSLFALIVYGNTDLALTMMLAMIITLFIAVLFGLAIPLSLHHFKRDPALGSTVLVTAMTDSIGFFILLGLATLLLL